MSAARFLSSRSITVQDNERDDLTRSMGDGLPRLAVSPTGTLAGPDRKAGAVVVLR
jgi:hypothetical protein